MKRRRLSIFATISLPFFLATAAVSARSYWFFDRWVIGHSNSHEVTLTIDEGQVRFDWEPPANSPSLKAREWHWRGFVWIYVHAGDQGPLHVRQSENHERHVFDNHIGLDVEFPLWFPGLIFAGLPICWLMLPIFPLRRSVLRTLAAASLLLCLPVVAIWVRSYWYYDRWVVGHTHNNRYEVTVEIYPGDVMCIWTPEGKIVYGFWGDDPPAGDWSWGWAGFGWNHYFDADVGAPNERTCLWFALWFPALLFALLPICWLITAIRRRRRNPARLCPACGYDLRASKDACPECGAAIPKSANR